MASETKPYAEVPLTQGKVALVDLCDLKRVLQYKWCASRGCSTWYAIRGVKLGVGRWTTQPMHRLILDAPKGLEVDHINGDGLDNRRDNIRIVTKAENAQNRIPRALAGMSRNGRNWAARVMVGGKYFFVGTYPTREEAQAAYRKAKDKYHGTYWRNRIQ